MSRYNPFAASYQDMLHKLKAVEALPVTPRNVTEAAILRSCLWTLAKEAEEHER